MSEEQSLYLTLLALCLVECVTWVPHGAVAFVTRGRQATLHVPGNKLANNRGALVIGNVLPGAGLTWLVPQWPLSMGRRGVLAWVSECLAADARAKQTGTYRALASVRRVSVAGRDVLIDGEHFLAAASGRLARRVADAIERLRAAEPDARAAILEDELRRLFDVGEARRRLDALETAAYPVRLAGAAVAAVTLVLAPLLVLWLGLSRSWPLVAASIYAASGTVAVLFVHAHRRLAPEDRIERWASAALQLTYPPSAMRAADVLAKHALHGLHPLAVAAALLEPVALRRFGETLLRDADNPKNPVCISDAAGSADVEEEHRHAIRGRLEEVLADAGIDPVALLCAPEPEEDCDAFCPRCLAQYRAAPACDDCGGLALCSFR